MSRISASGHQDAPAQPAGERGYVAAQCNHGMWLGGEPADRVRCPAPLRSHRYSRDGGELPATLLRSSQAAQDTFTEARDNAVQAYGEGDQADKAAFTILKKGFEKCGDHWIAKQ
jgi:hypothetical protein